MTFPRLIILVLATLSVRVSGLPALTATFSRSRVAEQVSQSIRSTWQNPSDTLTILLVIGGDVVLKALAQLSGHPITPVAFSFGWVAYSFNTLMSVVGDGRLMPPPDYPAKVINGKNGFVRDNRSWVLGRLLRDFERPLPDGVGLCITVFEASSSAVAGVPTIDWYWISGVIIIVLQIGISAIPCGRQGNWGILFITITGSLLALATGALPQWRHEKWACRENTNKAFCLTGGNGTRTVMVIIGKGVGLDLEDLAAAESPRMVRRDARKSPTFLDLPAAFWFTQTACLLFAILWIIFLITVTGLDQGAWFLLLVGGLGMAQNVIVAGARRGLGTSGIHLEEVEEFRRRKVMHALMDLEVAYAKIGKSLLGEFFPDEGGLRPDEVKWWKGDREEYDGRRLDKSSVSVADDNNLSEKVALARERYRKSK